MAPTSEERREVAARLREAWPEAGGMEEVWEVLDPILGTHDGPDVYKAWEQTFNRLADLIDPTCEIKDDNRWTSDFAYVCRACGEHFSTCGEPRYCPGCGRRIEHVK